MSNMQGLHILVICASPRTSRTDRLAVIYGSKKVSEIEPLIGRLFSRLQ